MRSPLRTLDYSEDALPMLLERAPKKRAARTPRRDAEGPSLALGALLLSALFVLAASVGAALAAGKWIAPRAMSTELLRMP